MIDAGGRGSRAPRWLTELGFQTPEETTIGCDFAYSSAKFRRPASYDAPEKVMLFGGPPPKYTDGAGIGSIENDTRIPVLPAASDSIRPPMRTASSPSRSHCRRAAFTS